MVIANNFLRGKANEVAAPKSSTHDSSGLIFLSSKSLELILIREIFFPEYFPGKNMLFPSILCVFQLLGRGKEKEGEEKASIESWNLCQSQEKDDKTSRRPTQAQRVIGNWKGRRRRGKNFYAKHPSSSLPFFSFLIFFLFLSFVVWEMESFNGRWQQRIMEGGGRGEWMGKGKGGKNENGKLRVFPIPRKSHNSFLVFSNTHIRIRKSCAMLFANLGNCNFISFFPTGIIPLISSNHRIALLRAHESLPLLFFERLRLMRVLSRAARSHHSCLRRDRGETIWGEGFAQ